MAGRNLQNILCYLSIYIKITLDVMHWRMYFIVICLNKEVIYYGILYR